MKLTAFVLLNEFAPAASRIRYKEIKSKIIQKNNIQKIQVPLLEGSETGLVDLIEEFR